MRVSAIEASPVWLLCGDAGHSCPCVAMQAILGHYVAMQALLASTPYSPMEVEQVRTGDSNRQWAQGP